MATSSKPYRGLAMEGALARWYAKSTSKSLDEFRSLAERLALQIPRNGRVLEVAPGPGYLAIELAKRHEGEIVGLDISQSFVDMATQNAGAAHAPVTFQLGNAAEMPFESGSFAFIVCRAAFKNFSRPVDVLNEMHRVLMPGGQALIIDLSKDASIGEIGAHVKEMKLGIVNSAITRMVFKHMLLKRAYSCSDFENMAQVSQFGSCEIHTENIGLEVRLTKNAN